MAFVTYRTAAPSTVAGVYPTQTAANTAAAADTTLTAYTGSVSNSAEPGMFFDATAGTASAAPPSAVAAGLREKDWLRRLGTNYTAGMRMAERWWPDEAKTSTVRDRSTQVLTVELAHWWRDLHSIAASCVAKRILASMTDAQREAVVAHAEALLAAGIIRIWYRVGVGLSASAAGPAGYRASVAGGYTDAYTITANVLTPRTPDYSWNLIAGAGGC